MTFKQAVETTAALREHYRQGLRAIGNTDRARIRTSHPRRLGGSVNIDAALTASQPQDPRWDCGIGISAGARGDIVVWLEGHPASSLHIDEVLAKLRWLRAWLAGHAPELARLRRQFHWVASGKIAFRRGSPQEKMMAQEGLRFPVKWLDLDSVSP